MNDDYQRSHINVNNLEKELEKHPDRHFVKYLLDGITNGFDTMVSKTELPTVECKNLQSAFRNPDSVDIIIKQEVDKGYLVGPFKKLPFDRYRVSPIEQCSLSYVKIDDAINAIKEFGRLSILNKADIADAFKQLGIKRDQHHLYCIKWRNLYYYYVRLCFGSRSSPKIFDNLSVAICWIAKNNYNIPVILHLLDDFLTVQASDTSGDRTMALITLIFNRLNIPLSKKKTVGPHTTLEYLGIILDTDKMEARLPQDKVERIIYFIGTFLRRHSIKKRELLQLLGHFNFAARVIIPGRTFVTYLINLSTKVNNLNYYVTLSAECRDDLKMWYIFLKQWNCVSFFYDTFTTNAADFELYTDAASTLGFGDVPERSAGSRCTSHDLSALLTRNVELTNSTANYLHDTQGHLSVLRKGYYTPYVDILLEAACVTAYFGFLRCGEFTVLHSFDSECNVSIEDIRFFKDKVTFHLKASKTDPFREGVDIHLFASGASVCPVLSLERYMDYRTRKFKDSKSQDAFFVMENRKALTRNYFISSLKNILAVLGYNSDLYNGHSFRIGASTTAGSKIEDHLIQTLGRWSSQCYTRYIRTSLSTIQQAQQALVE
ncbi:unnamed protein product [Mytilus edulis]|uniref:Reverse transcriptase domain-containing protein n=2 Tax=Mytilus TaxID=6548 RepID=A0A8S3PVN1_MYTED|nr:unnamed protein product [Mytilus edulis]